MAWKLILYLETIDDSIEAISIDQDYATLKDAVDTINTLIDHGLPIKKITIYRNQ